MSAEFLSIVGFGVAAFLVLDVACFAWLRSDAIRRSRPVRVERVVTGRRATERWRYRIANSVADFLLVDPPSRSAGTSVVTLSPLTFKQDDRAAAPSRRGLPAAARPGERCSTPARRRLP